MIGYFWTVYGQDVDDLAMLIYLLFIYIMDRQIKVNKRTAQELSEPPGPVGITSGLPGSTRGSSRYWKKGGGRWNPRHPLVR